MDGGRLTTHGVLVAVSVLLVAGCAPMHTWHSHTTSAPRPSFDLAALAPDRVAALRVLTPGGLDGFGPALSHGLSSALADAAPSLPVLPNVEAVNARAIWRPSTASC
jgi:hypothetical protein